jgi:AcrR family transcriptional regulator
MIDADCMITNKVVEGRLSRREAGPAAPEPARGHRAAPFAEAPGRGHPVLLHVVRQRIGAVRREEILRAAVEVVARQGFARARVQDVAAELAVSPALIFYHFDSKERLVSEAFQFAEQRDLAQLELAVTSPGTCTERLGAVLRTYLPAIGEMPGWLRDIDSWSEGRHSAQIRDTSQCIEARWRSGLRRVVVDGVAAGEFDCPDIEAAILRISVMLDGLAVANQVRRTVSRNDALTWVCEYAATELGVPDGVLQPGCIR